MKLHKEKKPKFNHGGKFNRDAGSLMQHEGTALDEEKQSTSERHDGCFSIAELLSEYIKKANVD